MAVLVTVDVPAPNEGNAGAALAVAVLPKRDGAAAPVGAGADAGAPNKLIVKSLITFTRLSTIESCNIVKKLQNYSPMAWD